MDFLEVNQSGGFPLTTNILNHLQNAASIFQTFGELAGDFIIISGCENIGSQVTDGVVYFNGEIFPFKGGSKLSKVRIIEINETKNFQDGTTKAVVFKRHVEFGTATVDFLWSNFKKIDPLKSLMSRVENLEKFARPFSQGGSMLLWNKPANEIPEGWREVINWRGRVPVGYDINQYEFNQIGKIGGEKTHKLINDEIPDHNHPMKLMTGAHYNSKIKQYAGSGAKTRNTTLTDTLDLQNTESAGGGQPHNNLQPYRVVIFIEPII
ncbi:hypothetical protein R8G64_13100 [Tenacibaculum maritimum]|uniref:phage baseplate protein n=1 Tax=Tenacibaculum maritimum TaxID=107401 RepID=UPI00387695FB